MECAFYIRIWPRNSQLLVKLRLPTLANPNSLFTQCPSPRLSFFFCQSTRKIEGLTVDMHLLKKVDSPLDVFGVNRKRRFEEINNKSSLSNVWNSVKRSRFGIFYGQSLGTAPGLSNPVVLETDAFSRMHKLKLLQLYHVHMSGSFEKFPKGLRWLCWHGFHFKSIPSDFPLESLVALDMRYSNLISVFSETKV